MTSKSPVRSAEDIDETALSYAEIKALCAGNPHIKEKMDLDIDVSRLKLLKANHLSQRYALEDQLLKEFPQRIKSLEQYIEGYTQDIDRLKRNTEPNEDGFSPMILPGGTDIFGNIQRLDNTLGAFEDRLYACCEQLENVRVQMENAKAEVQKPFPQEEELKTKTARLNELNALLNLDKTENEIIDGERGDEEPQKSSADRER